MTRSDGRARPTWLLRAYPARWRARYGEELAALLEDDERHGLAALGRNVDVVVAGAHERLDSAGLAGRGAPAEQRARANALLVLAAWALFVPAGIVLQRASEHWNDVVSWSGRQVPSIAFGVVQAGAVIGAVAIVVGGPLCGSRLWRWVRAGAWVACRRTLVVTAVADAAAAACTIGVIVWAHTANLVTPARPSAHRSLLVLGLWAVLVLAALVATTVTVVVVTRRLAPTGTLLRAEVGLSMAAALAMAVMCAASVLWWATVPGASRAVVEQGMPTGPASALYPPMVVVLAVMVLATVAGLVGGIRALSAVQEAPATA